MLVSRVWENVDTKVRMFGGVPSLRRKICRAIGAQGSVPRAQSRDFDRFWLYLCACVTSDFCACCTLVLLLLYCCCSSGLVQRAPSQTPSTTQPAICLHGRTKPPSALVAVVDNVGSGARLGLLQPAGVLQLRLLLPCSPIVMTLTRQSGSHGRRFVRTGSSSMTHSRYACTVYVYCPLYASLRESRGFWY